MNIVIYTYKFFRFLFLWIFRLSIVAAVLGSMIMLPVMAVHIVARAKASALGDLVVLLILGGFGTLCYFAQKRMTHGKDK